MDVLIDNRNNILNTTTYHKLTYSGLLLNFDSFTSRFYKISPIKCLIDLAYKINNAWASFHNDVTKIKETLKRNSFPPFLIYKIKKFNIYKHLHNNEECFLSFSILDYAPTQFQIKIKEGMYIDWEKPNLSKQLNHLATTLII